MSVWAIGAAVLGAAVGAKNSIDGQKNAEQARQDKNTQAWATRDQNMMAMVIEGMQKTMGAISQQLPTMFDYMQARGFESPGMLSTQSQ